MADLFSSSTTPGLKRAAGEIAKGRRPPSVPIHTFYELERIVDAVGQYKPAQVALQFPEALLADAAIVT